MHLSCVIVLPAYNEESNIARVVGGWVEELEYMVAESWRMIVIDDGSIDTTGAILDKLAQTNDKITVLHQTNQGHGAAIMNGYRHAISMDTDTVFQTDSDDQFDPKDFGKLWQRRNESQCILGFRARRCDPIIRILLAELMTLCICIVFFVRLKDSNAPYRLMTKDFVQHALPLIPAGAFAPNICLAIIASRQKQALLHIPVHHKKRMVGRAIASKTLMMGCIQSLGDLLRLRRNIDA